MSSPRRSRALPALVLTTALALVATACGDDGGGSDEPGGQAAAAPVSYADRGPYAVGQVDLELDPGNLVAVFYPVDADAVPADAEPYTYSGDTIFGPELSGLLPGALAAEVRPPDTWVGLPASGDGPFPVVLHSHGAAGNLRFANLHNAHTASWGHVVVVVDHPERGVAAAFAALGQTEDEEPDVSDYFLDTDQLLDGLDLALARADDPDSPLAGALDGTRVAAEGHSAGGFASGVAAYDERIDLWIGQAPVPPVPPDTEVEANLVEVEDEDGEVEIQVDVAAVYEDAEPPDVTSLVIAAEGDTIVDLDEWVVSTYDWLASPKRLAVIADSGHAVFVDPCLNIREEGGLSAFVETLGFDPDDVDLIELGENGCLPTDTSAEEIWPLIDHLTVAQLEETFGDEAVGSASLEEDFLDETFPGLLAELRTG